MALQSEFKLSAASFSTGYSDEFDKEGWASDAVAIPEVRTSAKANVKIDFFMMNDLMIDKWLFT